MDKTPDFVLQCWLQKGMRKELAEYKQNLRVNSVPNVLGKLIWHLKSKMRMAPQENQLLQRNVQLS